MDFCFLFPPDFSSCKGLHAAGYLQAGVDRFRAPHQIGGRISGKFQLMGLVGKYVRQAFYVTVTNSKLERFFLKFISMICQESKNVRLVYYVVQDGFSLQNMFLYHLLEGFLYKTVLTV